MSSKAKITATLNLETKDWQKKLDKGKTDLRAWSNEVQKMRIKGPSLDLDPAGGNFRQGMRYALEKYQHLRAAVTDVAALTIRAAGAPAQYADMVDSLTAVTGSAREAAEAMNFLASVSEQQKLEFEPLVSAYEHIRSLGYTARQSEEFIREMGNAIEFSGGQASQITDLAAALAKVADKGEVSVKALASMGQSMPFLRTILKEQFGSEAAADIEKLKLTSGELFEGIIRGLKRVETSKGGVLDALSPEYLASANRLRLGRAGTGETPMITDLPERAATPADPEGDAARVAAFRKRAAENEAAAAARDAEKKQAAGEAELAREQEKLELEVDIAKAAAAGNQQLKQDLEDRLAIMENAARMASEMGVSEERISRFLLKQLDARRDIERLQNEAVRKNEQAREAIDKLRSRGRNRAADKLEESQTKEERVKQLMERDGLKKDAATAQADSEAATRKDAAFREKTGRNRIRGARSRNTVSGLDEFPRFGDAGLRPDTPVLDSDPFTQRRMRPQTPSLDEMRRAQQPAARRFDAGDASGKGADKGSSDLVAAIRTLQAAVTAKLDEVKNVSTAPVAASVKPVNG